MKVCSVVIMAAAASGLAPATSSTSSGCRHGTRNSYYHAGCASRAMLINGSSFVTLLQVQMHLVNFKHLEVVQIALIKK